MPISFRLEATSGHARAGRLHTDHGEVLTPVFMPVGTQGAVKALSPRGLEAVGAQIILANTYHLVLRPGADLIEAAGGLHRFMGWQRPILTDSGGFQVLSLADLRKVTNEGIRFRSHVDGEMILLTPESAVLNQAMMGADLIMSFDYCTDYPCSREEAEHAVRLTTDWAKRGRDVFGARFTRNGHERWLFGIVQGSVYPDLRARSLDALMAMDFPGYAIGALSVGEESAQTWEITELVAQSLPVERPRYVMGMGTPLDLIEGAARGVDMFDCVMPTRNARNGTVFTRFGKIVLKNARYVDDFSPIDDACECYTCRNFSRAYLRHLFQAGEMLGPILATTHSLHFYCELMRDMRDSILRDEFASWRQDVIARYASREVDGARHS